MKLLRQSMFSDEDHSVRNASLAGLGVGALGTAGAFIGEEHAKNKLERAENKRFKAEQDKAEEAIKEKMKELREENLEKLESYAYKKGKRGKAPSYTFDEDELREAAEKKLLGNGGEYKDEGKKAYESVEDAVKERFNRKSFKPGSFRNKALIGTAIAVPLAAGAAYTLSRKKKKKD